jgi:hypothetical protein
MRRTLSIIALMLAAAIIPQASVATDPAPFTCSLVLRSQPTQEPHLTEHFSRQRDVSGAYACFHIFLGHLQYYANAYGPYRLGEVAFFRLSESSFRAPEFQESAPRSPQLSLLACFKERGTCSVGDFSILTSGFPETDLVRFKGLSEEIIRQTSTGALADLGLASDADLTLVGIALRNDRDELIFRFRSRFGWETNIVVRNNTDQLEVITKF